MAVHDNQSCIEIHCIVSALGFCGIGARQDANDFIIVEMIRK
jgi:hypothetical protein